MPVLTRSQKNNMKIEISSKQPICILNRSKYNLRSEQKNKELNELYSRFNSILINYDKAAAYIDNNSTTSEQSYYEHLRITIELHYNIQIYFPLLYNKKIIINNELASIICSEIDVIKTAINTDSKYMPKTKKYLHIKRIALNQLKETENIIVAFIK